MSKFVSLLVGVAFFEGVLVLGAVMLAPKVGAATVAPLPFKIAPGSQVVITCTAS
jgi:hypothetical protein